MPMVRAGFVLAGEGGMSDRPWMKFYPRDWRGDQALRAVSLSARGLWIEMLCIMHEAKPYGHLLIGDQPVSSDVLSRVVGASPEEVQALLVELQTAGVCRTTRTGVVYSKRMTDDFKRSQDGRKAKRSAIEQSSERKGEKVGPSRVPTRVPSTQRPEAREEVEGHRSPSTLFEGEDDFDLEEGRQLGSVVDFDELRERILAQAADMAARKAVSQ